MRPTLFAEEFEAGRRSFDDELISAASRILPKRCRGCRDCKPNVFLAQPRSANIVCERRGWLYPDMPDWWPLAAPEHPTVFDRAFWYQAVERMWRAMGITEEA